jgi:hypothetical protein
MGSKRSLVLDIKPEFLQQAREAIQNAAGSQLAVCTRDELISAGIFPNPSARFLERHGNLMLLPYGENLVWWKKAIPSPLHLGYHGGMSPAEMETPLMCFPLA